MAWVWSRWGAVGPIWDALGCGLGWVVALGWVWWVVCGVWEGVVGCIATLRRSMVVTVVWAWCY